MEITVNWQNLIRQMSKFGRLPESSKVAEDIIAAMTPAMRRDALKHFIKEAVEGYIRADTRSVEVTAQLRKSREEAEKYRAQLSEKHGIRFKSLEEANAYDDRVLADQIREKRKAEEERRQEIARSLLEDIRVQWSSELLNSGFKLGDGTATTWGAATIEQHESRIRMLMGNVLGNVDTMKRHEDAVIMLTRSGAACLNEVD